MCGWRVVRSRQLGGERLRARDWPLFEMSWLRGRRLLRRVTETLAGLERGPLLGAAMAAKTWFCSFLRQFGLTET